MTEQRAVADVEPGMPDCWVVVKDGSIVATHDAPGYYLEIDAVRYVPASALAALQAEVEALRDSCAAKADRIDRLGETVERLTKVSAEPVAKVMFNEGEVVKTNNLIDTDLPCGTLLVPAAAIAADRLEAQGQIEHLDKQNIRLRTQLAESQAEVEALRDSCAAKADRIDRLGETVERLREDAQRLDWIEQKLFTQKWNGVVGSDCSTHWGIAPDYRHTVHHMKNGDIKHDFRAAIDAARAALQGGKT